MSVPLSNNVDTTVVKTPSSADDVNDFLSDKTNDKPEVKDDKKPIVKDDKDVDKPEDEDIDLVDDEDDEDKLDLDEDKKPKKKDKEDEDDDEDDDEDKDEEELEDEDDEIEIEAPPRKKDILAAYPEFFKKFPWMEKMMYRDRQYTELFGSFDDAKEVAESAAVLNKFEQDLVKGDTRTVLSQIKNNSKESWDKIVDNYLPSLAAVDKEAYFEVAGSIGKEIITNLVVDARNRLTADPKDETGLLLKNTASILNQFLFGSTNFAPHKPRVDASKNTEDHKLSEERLTFARQQFETTRNELQTKVDKILRNTIADYIDPKNEMTPYVKKNAIKDALRITHSSIGKDPAFVKALDKLWDQVFNSNFHSDSKSKVQRTYLGKAKSVLKYALKKARAQALKGETPSRRVNDDEADERTPKQRHIQPGRPRQSASGKSESLKMKPGESVNDFLARD